MENENATNLQIKNKVRWIVEITGWLDKDVNRYDIDSLVQNWETLKDNIYDLKAFVDEIN